MSWAAVLLAVALLLAPGPGRARARLTPARPPVDTGPSGRADPLAFAAGLDVLAACLSSGMAVSTAAAATAPSAPPATAALLRRAADLLALGADPVRAWSAPDGTTDAYGESLLRLARRSAASGAALADGVAELAVQSRREAADAATATAERASVMIAGPLGLCFLPAFVCLGIVPVVAGLAGDVLGSGLL